MKLTALAVATLLAATVTPYAFASPATASYADRLDEFLGQCSTVAVRAHGDFALAQMKDSYEESNKVLMDGMHKLAGCVTTAKAEAKSAYESLPASDKKLGRKTYTKWAAAIGTITLASQSPDSDAYAAWLSAKADAEL